MIRFARLWLVVLAPPSRMENRGLPRTMLTVGTQASVEGYPSRSDPTEMRAERITINGKTVELPMVVGSEGETAVDIAKLRSSTGAITFDPGYGNTGACRSAITFIDGEKGILRYRGYPIEDLAGRASFLEVAYLLLYGELPNRTELDRFADDIRRHTMLNENFRRFFDALPTDAHPMPVTSAAVGAPCRRSAAAPPGRPAITPMPYFSSL